MLNHHNHQPGLVVSNFPHVGWLESNQHLNGSEAFQDLSPKRVELWIPARF